MRDNTSNTIEILQHDVRYSYRNGQDMPDHEQAHVARMITEGYREGELSDVDSRTGNLIPGWWQIKW